MAESLGFCQIGLAPPEFLGQELVLRNVYGAANVLFQAFVFDSPDAANVTDLTIGSHDSLGGIEGRAPRESPLMRFAMDPRSCGWTQSKYS